MITMMYITYKHVFYVLRFSYINNLSYCLYFNSVRPKENFHFILKIYWTIKVSNFNILSSYLLPLTLKWNDRMP